MTNNEVFFAIAIDGPSGSGKSTVAKKVASSLGYLYIDTGAMYRTVSLYFYKNELEVSRESVLKHLNNIDIQVKFESGSQRIYLDGVDVSEEIRNQAIAELASSSISILPEVRERLVIIQKELARNNNVVMDGRDIGSTVLKNANLKIYLEANIDVRTTRRINEFKQIGVNCEFETIKQEMITRDYTDSNRLYSPLVLCDDAIKIDSTSMNVDEVSNKILLLYRQAL
jgi:CMP/dCMP kinase